MTGRMALPVMRRFDNAGPDEPPPDPVYDDLGESSILRRGDDAAKRSRESLGLCINWLIDSSSVQPVTLAKGQAVG